MGFPHLDTRLALYVLFLSQLGMGDVSPRSAPHPVREGGQQAIGGGRRVLVRRQAEGAIEDTICPQYVWLGKRQRKDGSWGENDTVIPKPIPRDPVMEKLARPWIDDLGDEDPTARERAMFVLTELGTLVEPFLPPAVSTDDPELRIRVRTILDSLRLPEGQAVEQTALALLVYLGAGYTHLSKDTYQGVCLGDVIRSGLQYLIHAQGKEGAVGRSLRDGVSRGNVLGAFALSEAYGLTGSNFFKNPAIRAVEFIAGRQGAMGGWGDVETTLWSLMLLKSAELSGLPVARSTTEAGIAWLKRKAEEGGMLESAAYGLVAAFARDKAETLRMADRISTVRPAEADPFLRYVVGMTVFQADGPQGERWKAWNAAVRPVLLESSRRMFPPKWQQECIERPFYDLIWNTMSLQVYYRYANVFGGDKNLPSTR